MGFLGTGVLGLEDPAFVVGVAVAGFDVGLGRFEGEVGQVGRVRSHVGDAAGLVETLGDLHGAGNGEAELPGGFLLEGGRGERGRRFALGRFAFHPVGREGRTVGGLQDVRGGLRGVEALVELGLEALSIRGHLRRHPVVALGLKGENVPLPFHDEQYGHALDASCRQGGADLLPQHRREFIANKAVQHPAGLLGHDERHVDLTGVFDGAKDGLFRDLAENDALGLGFRQAKRLLQVPADGFSLAVLIRREPHGLGRLGQLLQLAEPALVGRHLIGGQESILHVHGQLASGKVPNVAVAGADDVIATQISFNGLGLRGALDDDEILAHDSFSGSRKDGRLLRQWKGEVRGCQDFPVRFHPHHR